MPLLSRDYILDMTGPSHVSVWACSRDIVAALGQAGGSPRYTGFPGAAHVGGSRVSPWRRPEAAEP